MPEDRCDAVKYELEEEHRKFLIGCFIVGIISCLPAAAVTYYYLSNFGGQ